MILRSLLTFQKSLLRILDISAMISIHYSSAYDYEYGERPEGPMH
jgi:hypothetical protein